MTAIIVLSLAVFFVLVRALLRQRTEIRRLRAALADRDREILLLRDWRFVPDASMPPDEVHFRDELGRIVGKIVNLQIDNGLQFPRKGA